MIARFVYILGKKLQDEAYSTAGCAMLLLQAIHTAGSFVRPLRKWTLRSTIIAHLQQAVH